MEQTYSFLPDLSKLLPEIMENTVVSRSLFKDDKTDVTLFGFAAGQELTEHQSPFTAIIHILQGEVTITLGKDTVMGQAGSWMVMPPHLPHSLRCTSKMVMLLTIIK